MWQRWAAADAPADSLSSVRFARSGAASLPPDIYEAIRTKTGVEVRQGCRVKDATFAQDGARLTLDDGGRAATAAAEVVIDASGQSGFLSKRLKLRLPEPKLRNVALYAHFSGVERPEGERAGEGMISLQRSFHTAGARSVIASLWKVPDDATAELMRNFYVRLWVKGESKGEALRGAQLDMIESRRTAHPFYWAAFTLTGDPGVTGK